MSIPAWRSSGSPSSYHAGSSGPRGRRARPRTRRSRRQRGPRRPPPPGRRCLVQKRTTSGVARMAVSASACAVMARRRTIWAPRSSSTGATLGPSATGSTVGPSATSASGTTSSTPSVTSSAPPSRHRAGAGRRRRRRRAGPARWPRRRSPHACSLALHHPGGRLVHGTAGEVRGGVGDGPTSRGTPTRAARRRAATCGHRASGTQGVTAARAAPVWRSCRCHRGAWRRARSLASAP